MDAAEIDRRFAYHPPARPVVADLHGQIRFLCSELAHTLNRELPESREKSLAFTHLEEVMMWANASVARILNYVDVTVPGDAPAPKISTRPGVT